MRDRTNPGTLAALLVLTACSGDPSVTSTPPSVVLVCMDTVRADHLGCYGYDRPTTPHLDALAARGVVFADASATAGWTKPSVPSFMTGTYPAQHGVYEGSARGIAGVTTDLVPEEAVTLAEVFQAAGYRTGAFVHNAQLKAGNGFEQGFDLYADGSGDARELRWQSLDWLDAGARSGDGERPFFLYVHVLDAHWPYPVPDEYATLWADAEAIAPYRGGDSRALRDAINDGEVPFGAAQREALLGLYDGSIRYVDEQLGLLLEGLEQRGLGDDTIVCVVADHGEEFGEHGRIGHGHGLWEGLLQVPWILSVPGREGLAGTRVEDPVSLVDLFPTLVGAAGLRVPATHAGVDRLLTPDAPATILAEHKAPDRYLQSAREGRDKVVRTFRPPPAPPALHPLSWGERYEAELTVTDGALVATQFKPRDEDPEDPPEIKGLVAAGREPGTWTVGGLPFRVGAGATTDIADGGAGAALAPGALAKVRGPVVDGVLVAERVKLYGPGEELVLELRGPLEDLEEDSAGRLLAVRMAGQRVLVDGETRFKDLDVDARPDMTREQVLAAVEQGSEAPGYAIERAAHDLSGLESVLEAGPEGGFGPWDRRLDALFGRLAERRTFSDSDRVRLSDETLDELGAIGYGGE